MILLFHMGKKYFGSGVGLVAAALYAFLPNGDYFGHSSWAQGLLAPFYVLIIFGMSQWLLEKKPWALAYLLPLAAWITGIHWGGILIFGVLALISMRFRAKLRPAALIVGVLISVLLWAPYLRFEQSRGYVDILAVVRGPLPAPEPWEVTSLCERPDVTYPPSTMGDLADNIGNIIQLRFPWLFQFYQPAHKLGGYFWRMGRSSIWSLGANFHWSPFSRGPGTWQEETIFFLGTLLFVIGLGRLVYRCWFRKNGSDAEKWLLLIFLLPAVLQNLTPQNSLARPDIAWLLYGPQILISAYTLSLLKEPQEKFLRVGLMVIISGILVFSVSRSMPRLWWGNYANPQRQMVSWIAHDVQNQGIQEVSIRYDFLMDMPEWCWIVTFASLDSNYYIGTEHDFLLLSRYNIHNTAKAMDDWIENPDYILLFEEGMDRYHGKIDKYQVVEFGRYVVLKVLKNAP